MYLHVWDSAGLLSATNAAGALLPGSGTDAITLSASYADITAVLASLSYAAAADCWARQHQLRPVGPGRGGNHRQHPGHR